MHVLRVNRYVELEMFFGMDATVLDGANPPWTPGTPGVPSTARSSVQRLKSPALEAWMPMVARCPTYVFQFMTVPLIIGEILAGALVQLFVRRMSSYVEPESILGLDAKLLDLANPPWIPGTLNVPNPAR